MESLLQLGLLIFQGVKQQHDIIQGDLQDEKKSEVHEEILPNGIDKVDSYTTESISLQGDVHKEYEK